MEENGVEDGTTATLQPQTFTSGGIGQQADDSASDSMEGSR